MGLKTESAFPPFRAFVAGEPADGSPAPGTDCPTCNRRVPKPKTKASPPTKHKGYWVPADEHKAHEEVLETAAKFLGCYEQAFYEFKTVTLALALILQDESLNGYAQRGGA